MLLAPPAYLDRPLYQLQYESLRWFDYWMKGVENEIMDEAPIKLWVNGTNEFKDVQNWPLPETKWTPFYLHENEIMDEHEYRVNEGYSSFEDSPYGRNSLEFFTPILVENTEVAGPISLNLYASSTRSDILFFTSIWRVDADGNEEPITRGWLRGSHRKLDVELSTPWKPVHPHTEEEKLVPGEIYEFNIEILPTGTLFKAGERIKLKISCADDKPNNAMEALGGGHIRGQNGNRITVYHNDDYPSNLLLPITKGNFLGTFRSGGKPYL
jgi:predicted acyl esterase